MRHHHETSPWDSWNYVLNHTKNQVSPTNIKLSCIPILSRNLGELLLFSLRRDELAWTKISVLVPCSHIHGSTPIQNNIQFIFIRTQTSSRHINHETEAKQPTYYKNVKTLASLTWKMLAKRLWHLSQRTQELQKQIRELEIVKQIQNGVTKVNPS